MKRFVLCFFEKDFVYLGKALWKKFAKFLTFDVIVPILGVGLASAGWMGKSKENSSIFFMLFYTFFCFRLVYSSVSCTLISDIHIRAKNYFHMQSWGSPLLTIASPRLNDGGEFILCSVKEPSCYLFRHMHLFFRASRFKSVSSNFGLLMSNLSL